ncbi:MAG: prolipoprotein diacylglyceryl transferase [Patescibacteria group bacterium]|jgi:phosphatidylglycerol:prolipoprotein diacylglycerol transferase
MNFFQTIHPQPVAFSLLGRDFYWYGLIISFSILIGFLIVLQIAKKKQIAVMHIYNLLFLFIVCGLIGGRIAYILTEWQVFSGNWSDAFKVWDGGISLYGVIIANLAALAVYSKIKKISGWVISDLIVLVMPLMQAIGRWGNYFNQELFGKPTSLPWSIFIETARRPFAYLEDQYFHPLFLYESLLMLGVFIVFLVLWRSGKLKTGDLTLLYFFLYSLVRFFLDFLRIEPPMLGWLSIAQWISVLFIAAAGLLWYFRGRLAGVKSQD